MKVSPRTRPSSVEVEAAYERVLADTSVASTFIEAGAGSRIHLLEKGDGPPLVLLHGTTASAGFFVPLLNELDTVRALAPDRPGHGLSDPIDLPRERFRDAVIEWLDQLLDTLNVDGPTLLGHSGGGIWALWYAHARPDRVRRLVVIAPPALPGTRCPLPIRLMATPGLGDLMSRLAPPSPKSMLRFAKFMGEQQTLAHHPELIDLLVATGRNPTADRVAREELRALASPFALLSRSGFRRHACVRPDELRQLTTPTLVMWGTHEPLGKAAVAQSVTDMIPDARLRLLPTGHAPWLGQPAKTATAVSDFVQ
jgi:pimeloyl-ACP methyl ester carboxylesterase